MYNCILKVYDLLTVTGFFIYIRYILLLLYLKFQIESEVGSEEYCLKNSVLTLN